MWHTIRNFFVEFPQTTSSHATERTLPISKTTCTFASIHQRTNMYIKPSRAIRYLYTLLGFISLLLGIIGIFVPLLPTTPFLLLTAALFFRGSPKCYDYLLNHPLLGTYIQNFRLHRAIPLSAKIIAITLIWTTLLYCAFTLTQHWGLRLLHIALATGISVYLLSFKTLKR